MGNTLSKMAVLIDGSNLHHTMGLIGKHTTTNRLDYSKFRDFFLRKFPYIDEVRMIYYTALRAEDEGDGLSPNMQLRPLIDWLQYNGFSIRTKMAKEYTDATTGRTKIKGNMDIEMVVDALQLADGGFEQIVLITGDGDFCYLVDALQSKGCLVTVMSSVKTQPSMVADELRKKADRFIEIVDHLTELVKEANIEKGPTRRRPLREEPLTIGELP